MTEEEREILGEAIYTRVRDAADPRQMALGLTGMAVAELTRQVGPLGAASLLYGLADHLATKPLPAGPEAGR